jgi:hypothetical protein
VLQFISSMKEEDHILLTIITIKVNSPPAENNTKMKYGSH